MGHAGRRERETSLCSTTARQRKDSRHPQRCSTRAESGTLNRATWCVRRGSLQDQATLCSDNFCASRSGCTQGVSGRVLTGNEAALLAADMEMLDRNENLDECTTKHPCLVLRLASGRSFACHRLRVKEGPFAFRYIKTTKATSDGARDFFVPESERSCFTPEKLTGDVLPQVSACPCDGVLAVRTKDIGSAAKAEG